MKKFNTIGIDLVSACANDIIVMGAKPVTFLDYIANDMLQPKIIEQIVSGMVKACKETGVSLKGLDQGLLDFPSRRFNEDVWLCWKDGETEIKFWHELDTGFNGRKPITVSDESLV